MRTLEQLGISPAPWKVGIVEGSDEKDLVVFDCNKCAVVLMHELKDYRAADARLIAVAPMLYECLREVVVALQNRLPKEPTYNESELVISAYRALAKASGESVKGETK